MATSQDHALVACRQTLAVGSKSFALAAHLLPPGDADRAAMLYAWCRRADDAVDLVDPAEGPARVAALRDELARCYEGEALADPTLASFQVVVQDVALPREYAEALLDGLEMDAAGTRYATLGDLYLYCHRVAGVVGLMMCHVFGMRDEAALRQAAHLGIAMQLTNICRDVTEDWERGRLYLPDDILAKVGAGDLRARLGEPASVLPRAAVSRAVEKLLGIADRFYRSGELGIRALPWRAGLAVLAARKVYAQIGVGLARRGFDPLAGRVVVSRWRKAILATSALVRQLAAAPRVLASKMLGRLPAITAPRSTLRFPDDVLPV